MLLASFVSRNINISVYNKNVKISKITAKDSIFPEVLKHIPSPPKLLYVLGDLEPLQHTKVVSVVGSRAVTPYGQQVTTRLSGELAQRGVAIVSGLALGVDALSHKAALDANGYTVAVLGNGLDSIQPTTNRNLALRILKQGGAIISEYPEGMAAFKQNFVARNRLVSGLCDGLLITEATERSGTLHTANFALEQGKAVMAVPGNITSGNSAGTNNLIKTGAVPITSVQDILSALNLESETTNVSVMGANAEEAIILELMKRGMTDINELQKGSELSPELFSQTMTMLEITAKVRPLGSAQWGIE